MVHPKIIQIKIYEIFSCILLENYQNQLQYKQVQYLYVNLGHELVVLVLSNVFYKIYKFLFEKKNLKTYGKAFKSASTIFIDVCGESAVHTFEFGWQTLIVASE
jgi:hypothetical protein